MDGLVTQALADVLRQRVDAATYAAITDAAGVDASGCLAGEPYPDAVTFALVAAAARRLGTDEGTVLEMLGEHHSRVAIEHRRRRADGAPHDEFLVRLES